MANSPTLTCQRGANYRKGLTVTYNNGDPIDLTDKTVLFTVKRNPDSLDMDDVKAVLKADITQHTDAVNGQTVLDIPHTETIVCSPGSYVYNIKIVGTNFLSISPIGDFEITANATNRDGNG